MTKTVILKYRNRFRELVQIKELKLQLSFKFLFQINVAFNWSKIQDITYRLTLVAVVNYVNYHYVCFYVFKEKGSQGYSR